LHNPLSWIQYVAEYLFPEEVERIKCRAVIHKSAGVSIVKVLAGKDQDTLWSMGFFGKGTLSRSDPSWFTRTSRRLNLEGSDQLPLTSEEIYAGSSSGTQEVQGGTCKSRAARA